MLSQTQCQQHKTEFTGLRQINTGARCHAVAGAPYVSQHADQHGLDHHRNDGQHQHPRPLHVQHVPIQLHTQGDEKQAQQHIVKRAYVFLHPVLVIGFGNQHAGHESAHGHGQSGVLGHPGQAQSDQQNIQHEQLFAVAPVDHAQPHAHGLLATPQKQPNQHRRF